MCLGSAPSIPTGSSDSPNLTNSLGNVADPFNGGGQQMGSDVNSQQLFGLFNSYGNGPRDGKCRATGTCDITS